MYIYIIICIFIYIYIYIYIYSSIIYILYIYIYTYICAFIYSPIKRSFGGPGGVGRGLDSRHQAQIYVWELALCGLSWYPVISRGIPCLLLLSILFKNTTFWNVDVASYHPFLSAKTKSWPRQRPDFNFGSCQYFVIR